MPSIEKISIALPPEMVSLVRDAVETGEYASSSEVIREALRDWSHKRSLRQQESARLRIDGECLSPLEKAEVQEAALVVRVAAIHGPAQIHAFGDAGRDAQPAITLQLSADHLALAPAAAVKSPRPSGRKPEI